ncbi:MAG: methyltransferase, partial [Thermoplasmatales archaeon]|nr:methyltransferase [Thermoplasmatales archaeon]
DPLDKSWFGDVALPDGTFAVRCKRFKGMMQDVDSQKIAERLGDELSKDHKVDLGNPDNVVRVVMSDRLHVFLDEHDVDREDFENRKVGNRPFFSPISLHPKYARALINMAGAKKGDTVLDPFCGTGGIAIEAAMMGFKAIASDFDPEMVAGTRENMEFYGLELHGHCVCDVGDVGDAFGKVDRVVTDPPYGRSTHTGGEMVDSICGRALSSFPGILRDGGSAGVVFPRRLDAPPGLRLSGIEVQKVHRSLSRHYHVFEKC